MTELCQRFQISRKTGYKWVQRFRTEGEAGLADRSRRPHHVPSHVPEATREFLLAERQQHPARGARKLRQRAKTQGLAGVILATLLILGMTVGILLVFSLEHQRMVVELTEGKTVSPELTAAIGQSRLKLIAIPLLLFLVGGVSIAAVLVYLHNNANTKENLEEVKGLARHILESIPTGVLTVSEDGIITAANPTAETILGRPAASLLGRHYGVVFGEGHPIQLAVAHRILQNHGGRIDVTALPGGGTSVVLSLPVSVPSPIIPLETA